MVEQYQLFQIYYLLALLNLAFNLKAIFLRAFVVLILLIQQPYDYFDGYYDVFEFMNLDDLTFILNFVIWKIFIFFLSVRQNQFLANYFNNKFQPISVISYKLN